MNKSIERQFHPFFHGFLLVTRDSSLRKLFRADEIELLVAGSQLLDFDQLASAADYDGGYTRDSPTIQYVFSTSHAEIFFPISETCCLSRREIHVFN